MHAFEYLPEDKDIILKLEEGVDRVVMHSDETKVSIQMSTLQAKAMLRLRKSMEETDKSNTRYSKAFIFFGLVQIVIGMFQILMSAAPAGQWQGKATLVLSVVILGLTLYWVNRSMKYW